MIVVLENGRIVEAGQHQKLLTNGGVSKKLFDMQDTEDEMTHHNPDVIDPAEPKPVATEEQFIDLDEPTQEKKWP